MCHCHTRSLLLHRCEPLLLGRRLATSLHKVYHTTTTTTATTRPLTHHPSLSRAHHSCTPHHTRALPGAHSLCKRSRGRVCRPAQARKVVAPHVSDHHPTRLASRTRPNTRGRRTSRSRHACSRRHVSADEGSVTGPAEAVLWSGQLGVRRRASPRRRASRGIRELSRTASSEQHRRRDSHHLPHGVRRQRRPRVVPTPLALPRAVGDGPQRAGHAGRRQSCHLLCCGGQIHRPRSRPAEKGRWQWQWRRQWWWWRCFANCKCLREQERVRQNSLFNQKRTRGASSNRGTIIACCWQDHHEQKKQGYRGEHEAKRCRFCVSIKGKKRGFFNQTKGGIGDVTLKKSSLRQTGQEKQTCW
jgi:hypothetical protein